MESPETSQVLEALRREQANATLLYFQYKGYHWNVAGALFHDLHLLFDDHAKTVLETVDPLAERQRMLGVPAEYGLETLRRFAAVSEDAHLPETPREMVERLLDAHRLIGRGLKSGFDLATRAGDVGSADLFTRLTLAHEKMEWFLRELLVGRSGLLAAEMAESGAAMGSRLEGVAQMGL